MRVNSDNLANMYEALCNASIPEELALAIVRKIREQYSDFEEWDGTLEISCERESLPINSGFATPLYVARGRTQFSIKVRNYNIGLLNNRYVDDTFIMS